MNRENRTAPRRPPGWPGLLLAAVLHSAFPGGAARAEAVLWADAADTSAVATSASWASNPAAPTVDDSGRVVWGAVPPRHHERRALALRRLGSPEAPGDSATVAWRWLRLDMPGLTGLPLYALRRAAPLFLAAGDSATADSSWEALAERSGLWRWESVRARAQLALAHGEPARGDSILEALEHRELAVPERAAWLAMRARLAAAAGDTARAIERCRQVVRAYPSLPPAADAIALLETLVAARGDSLGFEDQRDFAQSDALRGDRASAARRLGRAFELAPAPDRFRAGLDLAEALRLSRRYADAAAAAASACSLVAGGEDRALCLLERARIERDARRPAAAIKLYQQVVRATRDTSVLQSALWERAREAEQEGKLHQARADYERVAALGRRRAADGAFRAGLMWFAEGHAREAAARWARGDGEAARFWRAIALRRSRRSESDSLLAGLASTPGYSFYIASARETLGVRGWPGAAVAVAAAGGDEPALALATLLLESGLGDDGSDLASRWAGGEVRDTVFCAVPSGRRSASLIAAAQVAFAAGRTAQGIRLAQRAFGSAADSGAGARWGVSPWIYPPAHASLLRMRAEQAGHPAIDAPLLSAIVWQESRFDAAARSRSNALGLMQLKLGTARDALGARAVPAESTLFDPALNTRAGTRYLAGLLKRFGGYLPAALAGYNAGPGRVDQRWIDLGRRRGDALFCELVVYPETEDYVKKILSARSAFRELAPRVAATGEAAP